MMTMRGRILSVYRGQKPDTVPYMLDLSHWFYHKMRLPWDLSASYAEPERGLIDYHKQNGVGFYLANLAAFHSTVYPSDVKVTTHKRDRNGKPEIVWRIETPEGAIERARCWFEETYAWGITQWGIRDQNDLRVFKSAMARREYIPDWNCYRKWDEYVGDQGVVYIVLGYSAIGHLMHYWMGVEDLIYATVDWPDLMRETVDAVNENTLKLVDLVCQSPALIVVVGDNFSSDVQSGAFFGEWSQRFYREAISRLHRAGKYVAVHIDGRLRGSLKMMREVGADCADAVTPTPMGDLTTAECRAEAGDDFILSGGVSPNLWLPESPIELFEAKVLEWLNQKDQTFRFIANAGDQVPPNAEKRRITIMRDLVEKHGRFD